MTSPKLVCAGCSVEVPFGMPLCANCADTALNNPTLDYMREAVEPTDWRDCPHDYVQMHLVGSLTGSPTGHALQVCAACEATRVVVIQKLDGRVVRHFLAWQHRDQAGGGG